MHSRHVLPLPAGAEVTITLLRQRHSDDQARPDHNAPRSTTPRIAELSRT
jgi:hypothetical protein